MSENLDPLNLPGLKTEKRTDNGDHFALRVRVIDGRGYAFETIRAKALLSYGIHKASKPKFQRRPTSVTSEMIIGLELDRPVNLGVDIDLLTATISTPGAFSGSKMLKRPINH